MSRRHVGTLMRRMGIEAPYRKPNTSKRHPAHRRRYRMRRSSRR